METPSTIANTTFKVVKKGYDPDEVRAYLREVAISVQTAQDHAASVEQRARAAVAKAQEAAQAAQSQAQAQVSAAQAAPPVASDTEVISRTLLLAQKTADDTVRTAEREAAETKAAARAEADNLVATARLQLSEATETARSEARRAGDDERIKVEAELQQLLARLEFLRDDVTQMEAHAAHHRDRLMQVADDLQTIAQRSTAGLGETRRPVLSAAADLGADEVTATDVSAVTGSPEPMPDAVAAAQDSPAPTPSVPDASASNAPSAAVEDVTEPVVMPTMATPVVAETPPSPTEAAAPAQLALGDAPKRHLDDTAEVPVVE